MTNTNIITILTNTDVLEFIEDLETRFLLLPNLYSTDRLKVIAAVESLAGPKENKTDEPKQWASVELRFDEKLRDDWSAFREKLRSRYQNVELRERLVEERQALKQSDLTVQTYKQRFEQLCYQTQLPRTIWGDEFYRGLSTPIKDKLASIALLDRRDYNSLTLHANKFDEAYLARQRERAIEKQIRELYSNPNSKHQLIYDTTPNQSTPPTIHNHYAAQSNVDQNGKLTQSAKEYRIANNLCLFDGGKHPTHNCQKLIDKCKREGKPLPIDPATSIAQPN